MVSESGCFSFIRIPASFRSYSISEDQICGSGCGICKRFFSEELDLTQLIQMLYPRSFGMSYWVSFLMSSTLSRKRETALLNSSSWKHNTSSASLFLVLDPCGGDDFLLHFKSPKLIHQTSSDLNYNGKNFLWLSFCLYWSYADSAWNCTVPHWQDFVNGSDLA